MNEWMNNPKLKDLDPIKLELFKLAAEQTNGKTGRAMAPVMMSLISNANKRGIRFSPAEISLILDIIKEGKSDSEKKQIDYMVNVIQQMKEKHM